MKKIVLMFLLLISVISFASSSSTGATGILDFPNAYTLRENNYCVTGILDRIERDARVGFMLEGGFIKQLESGFKLSTKDKTINKDFIKSNIKFQFLQEGKNNPATAIGFIESDESAGGLTGNNDKGSAYGYIAASKRFQIFSSEIEDKDGEGQLRATAGLKYDEIEDWNLFTGIEIPVFQKVKILSEIYSTTSPSLTSFHPLLFSISSCISSSSKTYLSVCFAYTSPNRRGSFLKKARPRGELARSN